MPPATSPAESRGSLLTLLTPVVTAQGYDLEDVSVQVVGRRSVVRLVVDAESGVDLDAVAEVSRAVSAALDGADAELGGPLAGAYVLEVSSPGVDRPLTEPRHWRRALNRLVRVEVGATALTGRIVAVSGTGIELDVDSVSRLIDWAQLGVGRVQLEFSRKTADGDEGSADFSSDDEAEEG